MSNDDKDTINWKEMIHAERERQHDHTQTVKCTLTDDELLIEFDGGYGGTEGRDFTMWTDKRVYYPISYDGAEWVESAPRNPCDERMSH